MPPLPPLDKRDLDLNDLEKMRDKIQHTYDECAEMFGKQQWTEYMTQALKCVKDGIDNIDREIARQKGPA